MPIFCPICYSMKSPETGICLCETSAAPPTQEPKAPEEVWAVLELMGHIKYGGRIESNSGIGNLIRVEIPRKDGTTVTQLVNPTSIYRLTYTDKAIATAAALTGDPMPYGKWELKDLMQGPVIDPQPELGYPGYNPPDDDDDQG